tara:strand:- start:26 stop:319 length:294 start_codon:yes stop_codon:yes gene_type:complete
MNVNTVSGSYNLVAGDDQKLVIASNTVTVQQNVHSVADAITIYNSHSSSISINAAGGVTMRLGGTSTTGNRTLASKGLATIVCVASNEVVVTGAGLA